jgi:hypothetical protein
VPTFWIYKLFKKKCLNEFLFAFFLFHITCSICVCVFLMAFYLFTTCITSIWASGKDEWMIIDEYWVFAFGWMIDIEVMKKGDNFFKLAPRVLMLSMPSFYFVDAPHKGVHFQFSSLICL